MMTGWTGRLLRVNLSTGTSRVEDIPQAWMRDYIGGRGVADRYLWEEVDPTVDPLSPDNKLIFATGPLTGTPASCGARYMVVTKGALTGAITTSNSGGHWGPELKFAGYDLLPLEGRARHPRRRRRRPEGLHGGGLGHAQEAGRVQRPQGHDRVGHGRLHRPDQRLRRPADAQLRGRPVRGGREPQRQLHQRPADAD